MLSTSYEALYALDNLRSRSNLNKNQMALLIDVDPATYRISVNKLQIGAVVGLNGLIDVKIRYGIALLIHGLIEGLLPVYSGKTADVRYTNRKILGDLEDTFKPVYLKNMVSNDPTEYIAARREGREQYIPTSVLIAHAMQFTGHS